jgi:hypothetical protein
LPYILSRGANLVHRLDEVSDTRNIERAPLSEPGEPDFVYEMDRIHKEKKYAPKLYRRETLILAILLVGIIVFLMILGSLH